MLVIGSYHILQFSQMSISYPWCICQATIFELEKRLDGLISFYGRLINSILASFIHEIKCAPHSTTLTKCLHRLMQGSLACYTMFIRGRMQLAGACSAVQIYRLKPPSVARLRLSSRCSASD